MMPDWIDWVWGFGVSIAGVLVFVARLKYLLKKEQEDQYYGRSIRN